LETLLKRQYRRLFEFNDLYETLKSEYDSVIADYIFENLKDRGENIILSYSDNEEYMRDNKPENVDIFINMKPANKVLHLNNQFRIVNKELPNSGIYIGCFENRIKDNPEKNINTGVVSGKSLILNFQKTKPFKFKINKKDKIFSYKQINKNYSFAEMLGRLAFCGFEILNLKHVGNLVYFVSRKKSDPLGETDPAFNHIMQMKRIGKHGKIIGVYKFRTMYPYSEYIQDYVVKNNGYDAVGKPNMDFRVTQFGKIIRKIWIDEIPQLVNVIKGDMNLVGVRPITRFGYSNLSPELQIERIKYKPGLIPPNVSLKLTGFQGVIEAETKYLDEMKKNPIKTNIKYFFMAVFNILSFKANSN
jgi:lipopolysaccharide/colanic/teichoic acid biosynthesis glycosyltransferase